MLTVLRRLAIKLSAFVHRDASDRDVDDEVRYHLDREVERLVAQGVELREAQFRARRGFGNPTAHVESARETMRVLWLDQLGQDARYAFRALRATPVFTVVAVLSLALGVAANVAVMSAARAVLFHPLPVRHPEQLVSTNCSCSYSMYKDFSRLGDPFTGVAAITILDRTNVAIDGQRAEAMTRVGLASGSYFPLLGVPAALGRTLGPDDDITPDGHPIAVISYRFWQQRFAGSKDVLARILEINATRYTIVGVAAPAFDGEVIGRPIDVWVPLMMQSEVMPGMPGLLQRDNGFLRIIMRIRAGVSAPQAQAALQRPYRAHEMARAGANASAEFLRNLIADPLRLVSIERGYIPDRDGAAQSFSVLATVVAIVLLIACTNVATLFLVRGAARTREMAIRAALGAGGGRLFRQVLTEAVALSLLGGIVGVLCAIWVTSALSTTLSIGPVQLDVRAPSTVQSFDFRPGIPIFLFAAAASVLAGTLFGLLPARQASRALANRAFALRRQALGGPAARRGLGAGLVVAQVALSIVLLVATGLLVRSLSRLRGRELGVDRSHLLLVWTLPAETGRRPDEYPAYLDRMIERLGAIPGVASVSATNHGLLEGGDAGGESSLLTIDGVAARAGLPVLRSAVGPGFFATAGMTLMEGRDFRPSDDTSNARVGIMSQSMARYLLGNRSAIGRKLGAPRDPIEIIGVVNDTKHGTPRDPRGVWYVSYRQMPALMRNMCVVVKTRAEPAALRRAVTIALREFDPKLPVLRIDTLNEQLDDVLFQERALATMSIVFATLAGLLACIGLYGMMAYAVARRTSEIGVRMALGTTSAAILRLVLGESLRIVLVGVLVGIPAALLLARVIRARLYEVSPADPLTVIAAAGAMLVMATGAAFIPSRRAATIDPAISLRAD